MLPFKQAQAHISLVKRYQDHITSTHNILLFFLIFMNKNNLFYILMQRMTCNIQQHTIMETKLKSTRTDNESFYTGIHECYATTEVSKAVYRQGHFDPEKRISSH